MDRWKIEVIVDGKETADKLLSLIMSSAVEETLNFHGLGGKILQSATFEEPEVKSSGIEDDEGLPDWTGGDKQVIIHHDPADTVKLNLNEMGEDTDASQ